MNKSKCFFSKFYRNPHRRKDCFDCSSMRCMSLSGGYREHSSVMHRSIVHPPYLFQLGDSISFRSRKFTDILSSLCCPVGCSMRWPTEIAERGSPEQIHHCQQSMEEFRELQESLHHLPSLRAGPITSRLEFRSPSSIFGPPLRGLRLPQFILRSVNTPYGSRDAHSTANIVCSWSQLLAGPAQPLRS